MLLDSSGGMTLGPFWRRVPGNLVPGACVLPRQRHRLQPDAPRAHRDVPCAVVTGGAAPVLTPRLGKTIATAAGGSGIRHRFHPEAKEDVSRREPPAGN